jgi:hypothetical protein
MSLGDKTAATYAGYAASLLQSGETDRSAEIIREGLVAFPDDPVLRGIARSAGAS